MTNKEKLISIKNFLAQNKIWYDRKFVCPITSVEPSLFLPRFQIIVQVIGKDNEKEQQEFYKKVSRLYRPLFIREHETVEFVLEKLQNLIIQCLNNLQKNQIKKEHKQ